MSAPAPRGAADPVLSIRGLTVSYGTGPDRVRAVRDVTVDLARGSCLAVIGESGSGKSTFARALVGLGGSDVHVEGSITYRDRDGAETSVVGAGPRTLQRLRWAEIAYVSQSAISSFNPVMTVGAHVDETSAAHGGPRGRALTARAQELLAAVRLGPDVLRAYPHELSGGMRQRTLLALALLLEPQVLVLDEPTTALDVLTQRAVLEVLRGIQHRTGLSVVLITHDIGAAALIADEVLTLYAGAVAEHSPLADLRSRGPLHPYTAGLMTALPSLHGTRVGRAIPGAPPDMTALPAGCAFAPRCPRSTARCVEAAPPLADAPDGGRVACFFPLTEERPRGGSHEHALR